MRRRVLPPPHRRFFKEIHFHYGIFRAKKQPLFLPAASEAGTSNSSLDDASGRFSAGKNRPPKDLPVFFPETFGQHQPHTQKYKENGYPKHKCQIQF
jgi:hypothetical protein